MSNGDELSDAEREDLASGPRFTPVGSFEDLDDTVPVDEDKADDAVRRGMQGIRDGKIKTARQFLKFVGNAIKFGSRFTG